MVTLEYTYNNDERPIHPMSVKREENNNNNNKNEEEDEKFVNVAHIVEKRNRIVRNNNVNNNINNNNINNNINNKFNNNNINNNNINNNNINTINNEEKAPEKFKNYTVTLEKKTEMKTKMNFQIML